MSVNSRIFVRMASTIVLSLTMGAANSAPISNPGDLTAGATIITFDEFAVGTQEPLSLGIVTITSSAGNQQVRAQGFTQHPGIFEGQYFGFKATNFIIDFSQPIQEFGMGIFDPNFSSTKLQAFDSANNLLEQLTPTLGPPGGSQSDFAGFIRNSADISRIVLSQSGDLLGIDNVSYNVSASAVPVPAAVWLFGSGLIGLFGIARKKQI